MERVVVVGSSGSGKTTLARTLAKQLELTHIVLDAIFHQPGWVPRPPAEFIVELGRQMSDAGDRWVTCGNYVSVSGNVHMRRADTIVSRTVRRALTREELWNGNREPLTNFYRWDPEKNLIRWARTRFDRTRTRYEEISLDGTWSHADVYRLHTPAEVSAFESGIS